MFAEAERVARGDDALVKQVLVATAELASQQGDFKRSRDLLERVQTIVVESGDLQEEHKALVSLAQSYAATGERQLALDYLAKAAELLPNDATAACERQKHIGLVEYFARDWAAAAAASDRAVDLSRALGLTYEVAVIPAQPGGQPDAQRGAGASVPACSSSRSRCARSRGYERLTMAQPDVPRLPRRRPTAIKKRSGSWGRGVRYAEAHDYTWDVIGGRLLQAQLFARARRARDGPARVREAAGHCAQLGEPARHRRLRRGLADARQRQMKRRIVKSS